MWFKSKQVDKTITCPPSEVCSVMDCRLADLRANQAAQKELASRIKDLEDKYFPMVYWWVVICTKVGQYCFLPHGSINRGNIENTLQMTLKELQIDSRFFPQGLNVKKFDVDQFCTEMKDMFSVNQQIVELRKELSRLQESEKNLKQILQIK